MKECLSKSYHKRMVLHLNVLKNEKRQNKVLNPKITSVIFMGAYDETDNTKDSFTVELKAQANDKLMDTEIGKLLYQDNSIWTEYWTFAKENNILKLDMIK